MKKALALFSLFASVLIGCGGGGGGGSDGSPAPSGTPTTTTFPIASAVSAFLQTGHSYTLSAVDGSDTYTIQFSYTPGSQQTFEGHLSSTMVQSALVKKNGTTAQTASGTMYFDVSPFKAIGFIESDGHYEVISNQQTLPSSATAGQIGALDSSTTYTSSTKTSTYSTDTRTWSLEADTASTAWACFNTSTKFPNSTSTNTTAECYKIDTSGNVSALKITIYVNGQSVTFK
ncbi:MAG: hypothetical protein WC073_04005 [Sterolibacterium sp.]